MLRTLLQESLRKISQELRRCIRILEGSYSSLILGRNYLRRDFSGAARRMAACRGRGEMPPAFLASPALGPDFALLPPHGHYRTTAGDCRVRPRPANSRSLVPYACFLYFRERFAPQPPGKNDMKTAYSHPQTELSRHRPMFQDSFWSRSAVDLASGLAQLNRRVSRWNNCICSQRT